MPDAQTRQGVLQTLCTAPDALTPQGGFVRAELEQLASKLTEFAHTCRRMQSGVPASIS